MMFNTSYKTDKSKWTIYSNKSLKLEKIQQSINTILIWTYYNNTRISQDQTQLILNQSIFAKDFVYEIIKYSNNSNLLKLPGMYFSLEQLLNNKYQTSITNLTDDPDELVNLTDSNRICEFNDLDNILLNKLYQNIDKNNLSNIFISLPSKYIFSNSEIMSYYK